MGFEAKRAIELSWTEIVLYYNVCIASKATAGSNLQAEF